MKKNATLIIFLTTIVFLATVVLYLLPECSSEEANGLSSCHELESFSKILRNFFWTAAIPLGLWLAYCRSDSASRQVNAALEQNETAQKQAQTMERGLLNERYQRGANMLGSETAATRLGGIAALERLAGEHVEDYYIQTMDVLCAFARHPTQESREGSGKNGINKVPNKRRQDAERCRLDVERAIQAISRRDDIRIELELKKIPGRSLIDLRQVDLRGANLMNANLTKANLTKANLMKADLRKAMLMSVNLSAHFSTIPIPISHLTSSENGNEGAGENGNEGAGENGNEGENGTDPDANSQIANLRKAKLMKANLTKAILTKANLTKADLTKANLTGAILTDAILMKALLGKTTLTKATLTKATLTGATLTKATLTGATLTEADLKMATLVEANLKKAILEKADLTDADMTDADLLNANLGGANLTNAKGLTQTELNRAGTKEGGSPPKLGNTVCAVSGDPLVWNGKTLS